MISKNSVSNKTSTKTKLKTMIKVKNLSKLTIMQSKKTRTTRTKMISVLSRKWSSISLTHLRQRDCWANCLFLTKTRESHTSRSLWVSSNYLIKILMTVFSVPLINLISEMKIGFLSMHSEKHYMNYSPCTMWKFSTATQKIKRKRRRDISGLGKFWRNLKSIWMSSLTYLS